MGYFVYGFLSYSLRNCFWSSCIGWRAQLSGLQWLPTWASSFCVSSVVWLWAAFLFVIPFCFSRAEPLLISAAARHGRASVSSAPSRCPVYAVPSEPTFLRHCETQYSAGNFRPPCQLTFSLVFSTRKLERRNFCLMLGRIYFPGIFVEERKLVIWVSLCYWVPVICWALSSTFSY